MVLLFLSRGNIYRRINLSVIYNLYLELIVLNTLPTYR